MRRQFSQLPPPPPRSRVVHAPAGQPALVSLSDNPVIDVGGRVALAAVGVGAILALVVWEGSRQEKSRAEEKRRYREKHIRDFGVEPILR